MQIRNPRDFASGAMFLVIGAAFAIGALAYPMGRAAKPGAGYFPLGLGVLLAVLGLVVLLKSLGSSGERGEPVGAIAWRPLLIVIVSIAVFGFMLPRAGMLAAIPVLIGIVSMAGGRFDWKSWLISSVVLGVGCWAVFIYGLGLTIPLWPTFLP